MHRPSIWLAASCLALASFGAAPALAQESADTSAAAILWYRSSGKCPSGPDFLDLLGEKRSMLRLASAGDHVDFVVNLSSAEGAAEGRLERETGRGTVAIREVKDASCQQVAEVMALNLSMALDSTATAPEGSEAPPLGTEGESSPETVSNLSEAAPAPPKATQSTEADEAPSDGSPEKRTLDQEPEESAVAVTSSDSDRRTRLSAGLQAGLLSGLGPHVMARGALFGEMTGVLEGAFSGASLRGAAVMAGGAFQTASGRVGQLVWAGRLDVCPLSWGTSKFQLRPCVAGELGQIRASGALSPAALWAAWAVHGRASWVVQERLSLQAEVGALLPLLRYEVTTGSTALYTSEIASFSAVLGAAVHF